MQNAIAKILQAEKTMWKWCGVRIANGILQADAQMTECGADCYADTWMRTDSALEVKGDAKND